MRDLRTRILPAATVLLIWIMSAAATPAPVPAPGASGAAPAAADTARAGTAWCPAPGTDPDSGDELIGTPAPAWDFDRWARGGPIKLADLRGKVVVLRWWTEQCRFCRNTLPALEKVREAHRGDDVVVIGVFHPKPPRPVSDAHVLKLARELGFDGPIAVDTQWKMLDRYWLDGNPERNWTSVSFMIDREGRLCWVHGGGEFHPTDDPKHARCDIQFRDFEKALDTALAERAQIP